MLAHTILAPLLLHALVHQLLFASSGILSLGNSPATITKKVSRSTHLMFRGAASVQFSAPGFCTICIFCLQELAADASFPPGTVWGSDHLEACCQLRSGALQDWQKAQRPRFFDLSVPSACLRTCRAYTSTVQERYDEKKRFTLLLIVYILHVHTQFPCIRVL